MLKRSGTTTVLDPETAMLVRDVYSQHYDELLRKACIMLHDTEDARDAVSEVMARLMTADILPEGDKLLAYVRNSVRHECLNRLKRMRLQERLRRALPLDDREEWATGEELEAEEEQYRQYRSFVDQELTPQTRRVFQMHYGQRMKYREIAEQVGISESAVYKHLSQAIVKLKNRFNS